MIELPENAQHSQGTLHTQLMMAVIAVMISLFPLLLGCSSDESKGQLDESRRTDEGQRASAVRGGQTGNGSKEVRRTETQAALVPIAHLSSTAESINTQELSETQNLAVGQGYRDEAEELIDSPRFESFDSGAAVVGHVSKTPDALGLVPWDEVGPRVKALSVDGRSLLDSEGSGDYPLAPDGATVPDPEELRHVVVGGDIVLDRGQYYMVIQKNMGIDFPLDGGYAAVTSRVPEQSIYSETGIIHQFTARRTGSAGAVREYLSGADLTLANFENPVIRDAVYHPDATTFTGDLRLMPVLDQAGMDLAEARKPMVFDLGGTEVGVLSYLAVPSYGWAWATQTAPGTAPLLQNVMEEDIKRLRPRVDLILVMPHWGKEYIATPEPQQVDLAHAALDAGADLVIGGHAHWPKGIEVYEGKPIFYGVGNFLLDQSWSEETSTGIFAEITLYGDDVVQVRPVPFIMLDYAQPNFLMPGSGGDRALRKIFAASLGPEFKSYGGRAR